MKIKEFITTAEIVMKKHNRLKRQIDITKDTYSYACIRLTEGSSIRNAKIRVEEAEKEYNKWMEKELTKEDLIDEDIIG